MTDRVTALTEKLIADGLRRLESTPFEGLAFAGEQEANALLNPLGAHPHAFVMGCLVDRQIPAERAWRLPLAVKTRCRERTGGSFMIEELAKFSEDDWLGYLVTPTPADAPHTPPSLHRFPSKMARVLYLATQRIVTVYKGDASRIWQDRPSSARLVRRFLEFHGAGPKIACMAANILVRNVRIPVSDYRYIDISADVLVRRVMGRLGLVEEGARPDVVIYAAREMNPDFPGVFDTIIWEIGRNYCHPREPACPECPLHSYCAYASNQQ